MMTSDTQQCTPNTESSQSCGTTIPFDSIQEPGCYVCSWSGHLMRLPSDGIAQSRAPLINIVGPEPLFVTKLSDNPFISVTKARLVACNLDCSVNF